MMSTEALAASAAPGSRIEAGPRGAKPRTLTFGRVGVYVFLVLAALFFLMPLWVMVVTSLKAMPEIQLRNIFQWPQQITFEPWLKAWDTACTGRDCNGLKPGFLNSVKITVVGTVISIIIAALNGYALSFWKYKGADILFGLLVFGAFVPYQVVIYPLIVGFRELGIFGTFPGIIAIHTIFGMPILTLLFRNFFRNVPKELFEAARLDGASYWGLFWRIAMPLSIPSFVIVFLFEFQASWNNLQAALIYLNAGQVSDFTAPLGIAYAMTKYSPTAGGHGDYQYVMVASLLVTLPMLIMFAFGQRYFIEGVATQGRKG